MAGGFFLMAAILCGAVWGIAIGTYSSLFIAAPILYYVQPNRRSLAKEPDEPGRVERASG